ncbi:hypothetical protein [Streptosporangium carneum]|uniref:Integral membrane protein n=1 Tax=Streptosporangium carneum TaxID=47481 RepID=A0A9W6I648_9ACTN|nr:hypothetical protein [Streptosporangium carneum]GLK11924.1 hypothetical protein GCM10017600_53320 [Streptosporangium carneum]
MASIAPATPPTTGTGKLLRLALRLDAVVTGGNGLAYLLLAEPINDLLGLSVPLQRGVGAFLAVYGVAVWLLARPATVNRTAVLGVVAVNALWTVASVAELALGGLDVTVVGAFWVVMQAVTVGGFAALQYLGLRASR